MASAEATDVKQALGQCSVVIPTDREKRAGAGAGRPKRVDKYRRTQRHPMVDWRVTNTFKRKHIQRGRGNNIWAVIVSTGNVHRNMMHK